MEPINDKISCICNMEIENTKIISVTYINTGGFNDLSGLPTFYRVVYQSSCGENSMINTELWLPEEWNGVFVGVGNGGMAGNIIHKCLADYVVSGYAVAQTDMGTAGGIGRGIGNPDVWKDFGWRATHIMTRFSKEILHVHYGCHEKYAYFVGGSTGGQQAFSEAQRFPEDYDGIIAGVPAHNRVFLHTYFLWNHNHLRPQGGQGLFREEEIEQVRMCATKYFQKLGDGVKGDDFITFPCNDADTVKDFMEHLKKHYPKLGQAQLEALEAVYLGPVNPVTGRQIYNGMPIGSEAYACGIRDCQMEESPYFYPFIWIFGPGYDGYGFDFDKDLCTLDCMLSEDLNANKTDLGTFREKGRKMIAYSGSADPCVPFPDAARYYERAMECMGGYEETASFFRYFLCPGRDHGTTGRGANELWGNETGSMSMLDTLRLWCEKDIAPQSLIAARTEKGAIKFARKIYPYGSPWNPKRKLAKTCDPCYLDHTDGFGL